jgi:hypothetical protein
MHQLGLKNRPYACIEIEVLKKTVGYQRPKERPPKLAIILEAF